MFTRKATDPETSITEQAARSADNVIEGSRRVANDALDSLSGSVHDMQRTAEPLLSRAAEQASLLAQRGAHAVHDGTQHVRETAQHAPDATVNYIKHEPVKAMLMAAATGAALMGLLSVMRRPRS
jgi:ElaB/YqjD/DUF883 family membrane-anchored ribosome-binding protein